MQAKPTREEVVKRLRERKRVPPDQQDIWQNLRTHIEAGKILPIIGQSVFNSLVFSSLLDSSDDSQPQTVTEALADMWASTEKYPFADTNRMARVAQFVSHLRSADARGFKTRYQKFLKELLLTYAELEGDEDVARCMDRLRARCDQGSYSFSRLATDLGYPRTTAGKENPLLDLARLQLPVYVTTSHYDFMERALDQLGRSPRTHVCFWDRIPSDAGDHYPDGVFEPTSEEPVVYHLYGFGEHPESIMLSEDDYIDFLVKIAGGPTNTQEPIIPSYLRQVLADCPLVMLGYRLQDWDFRVLFRAVLPLLVGSPRYSVNVAIQLEPRLRGGIEDEGQAQKEAKSYLEKVFGQLEFRVVLSDASSFATTLAERFKQWRRS